MLWLDQDKESFRELRANRIGQGEFCVIVTQNSFCAVIQAHYEEGQAVIAIVTIEGWETWGKLGGNMGKLGYCND